jgi:hypothetical protein
MMSTNPITALKYLSVHVGVGSCEGAQLYQTAFWNHYGLPMVEKSDTNEPWTRKSEEEGEMGWEDGYTATDPRRYALLLGALIHDQGCNDHWEE